MSDLSQRGPQNIKLEDAQLYSAFRARSVPSTGVDNGCSYKIIPHNVSCNQDK